LLQFVVLHHVISVTTFPALTVGVPVFERPAGYWRIGFARGFIIVSPSKGYIHEPPKGDYFSFHKLSCA
jgi:hypothetical protein